MYVYFDWIETLCVVNALLFSQALGEDLPQFLDRLAKGELPKPDVIIGGKEPRWLLNNAARYIPIGEPTQAVHVSPFSAPVPSQVKSLARRKPEYLRLVNNDRLYRVTDSNCLIAKYYEKHGTVPVPDVVLHDHTHYFQVETLRALRRELKL